MKVLRFLALGLALGVYAVGAKADLVTFFLDVHFAVGGGPLGGTTVRGALEANCPAHLCNGTYTPAGPDVLHHLQITIDGTTFTAADDSGYPLFPAISISNNVITGIDLIADLLVPGPGLLLQFFGDPLLGGGSYVSASGELSLIDQVTAQVPEPATAALLGVGLLAGLGVRRQKRRATAALAV